MDYTLTFRDRSWSAYAPNDTDKITRHWERGMPYEAREGELLAVLADMDFPRGYYVDAGAHWGNHAMFAHHVLGFDNILCFEASVENFDALVLNVGKFAQCQWCALSDHKGHLFLHDIDTPHHSGSKYLSDVENEYTVFTSPLDWHQLDGCDLLKIDVEGHELQVLQGARQTIKKFRPVIAIEVWDENFVPVAGLLEELGYTKAVKTTNATPTYIYTHGGSQ